MCVRSMGGLVDSHISYHSIEIIIMENQGQSRDCSYIINYLSDFISGSFLTIAFFCLSSSQALMTYIASFEPNSITS